MLTMIPVSRHTTALIAAAAALALGAAGSARAPRNALIPVPTIVVPKITSTTMNAVVKEISSDAYEGRGPGTPAEDKTISYIVSRLDRKSVV